MCKKSSLGTRKIYLIKDEGVVSHDQAIHVGYEHLASGQRARAGSERKRVHVRCERKYLVSLPSGQREKKGTRPLREKISRLSPSSLPVASSSSPSLTASSPPPPSAPLPPLPLLLPSLRFQAWRDEPGELQPVDAVTDGEALAKGSFGQVESDGLQGEEQGVAWRRYRISASPHDPPLPPEHN